MAKIAGKNKNEKPVIMRNAQNWVAYCYIILMLGGFPLFYRNNYIDIMESKWLFFMISTFAAVAGIIIAYIRRFIIGPDVPVRKGAKNAEEVTKKKFWDYVVMPDIFLAVLAVAVIFSWIGVSQYDYFVEAWDGSQGKMAGVFFYLILILAYIVVSRFLVFDGHIITVYLWVNLIVFALAIFNHFSIDILHMYENLVEDQYWMFCSTMGNINVLAGYFCVFVPVTVVCFVFARDIWAQIAYGCIMTVSFMGIVAANGDSAILGVAAAFLFIFFFCFENWNKLSRFFMAIALFFTSTAIIGALDAKYADIVKEPLETFPSFVSNSAVNRVGIVLFWLLTAICYFLNKKEFKIDFLKIVRNVFFTIIALVVVAGFGTFLYFSIVDVNKDLGQWETYLRYSDWWGSSRGFTWTRVWLLFTEYYEPYEQIFGFGPDLMVVPLHAYFEEEIFAKMGAYLVDAHSEFFQTLGSLGIVGVIGYFGFQIAVFVRLLKNRKTYFFLLAVSAAIVGYVVQGMLGSPQTFSTPMLFIFIAIGEAIMRNGYIEEEI